MLTILGIGIVLLLLLLLYWSNQKRCIIEEGFQYKTLNVPYNKEVFLVGNPGSNRTSPDYNASGVTYAEAAATCQQFGATVATLDQLKLAMDASANWCKVGGWIAGDENHLYYPEVTCTDSAPCADEADGTVSTRDRCVRKIPVPASKKGFVTCYGEKPPLSTDTAGRIQNFNDVAYSILDTKAVADTMAGGTESDLLPLPYTFTAAQALWALERPEVRFTTVKPATNVGKTARQWLRENLDTVNTTIRNTVDPDTAVSNENLTEWRNAKSKSCDAIGAVRTDIMGRLSSLKSVIAAVEARTKGTYDAKQENSELQRQIAYICQGLTAAQSPACSRLASIDFDIFYKPSTSGNGIDTKILSDLQMLNYTLRLQECYIQKALLKLQILGDFIKCPAPDATTIQALGDYKATPTTYYPDTCEPLEKNPQWAALAGENDKRFTIKKNIGYVSVDSLLFAFEEISPFFSYAGYQGLFQNLLQYLTILIRIPDLNDYYSSDENFKTIPTRVSSLVSSATAFFTSL